MFVGRKVDWMSKFIPYTFYLMGFESLNVWCLLKVTVTNSPNVDEYFFFFQIVNTTARRKCYYEADFYGLTSIPLLQK